MANELKCFFFQPVREAPGKNAQKAKQNGKDSKPSTPASKSKVSEDKLVCLVLRGS